MKTNLELIDVVYLAAAAKLNNEDYNKIVDIVRKIKPELFENRAKRYS